MPRFKFTGKVLPRHVSVSFNHLPSVKLALSDPSYGLDAIFHISIKNSDVEFTRESNRATEADFQQLYLSAFELVRSTVDLMVFSIGKSLSVTLDTAVYEDGSEKATIPGDPLLPPLCTAFDPRRDTFGKAIEIVTAEPALMLALNDLTSSLEAPYRIAINSARAIERIRHIISPGSATKQSWENSGDMLQIDRSFLEFVTALSIPQRHGEWVAATALTQAQNFEARRRAWQVVNRFLEYRIRGNTPLPKDQYPILK